jgi:DNA-directed RNA polymerase II subunit RPB2
MEHVVTTIDTRSPEDLASLAQRETPFARRFFREPAVNPHPDLGPIVYDAVPPNLPIKSSLKSDVEVSQSGQLLRDYINSEGFAGHNIEVYDDWVGTSRARHNISGLRLVLSDSVVCFENLRINPPTIAGRGSTPLTPKLAREKGLTYGCDWSVDMVERHKDDDTNSRPPIRSTRGTQPNQVSIGIVPLMLKSSPCVLRGKTPEQLARLGEDPNDPGGYFIVNGVEKVILLQEQLASNRILLMQMGKGVPTCRIIANTNRGTALTEIALEGPAKGRYSFVQVRFPSLRIKESAKEVEPVEIEDPALVQLSKKVVKASRYKSINILKIFKFYQRHGAVDFDDPIELIRSFVRPDRLEKSMLVFNSTVLDDMMSVSIAPSGAVDDRDIQTFTNFLELETQVPDEVERAVWTLLNADLFPHLEAVPGIEGETLEERQLRINLSKTRLLALMTAMYLEYHAGYRQLSDPNSWSRKKIVGVKLMENLIRTAWRGVVGRLQGVINDSHDTLEFSDIVKKITPEDLTKAFQDSFTSTKWGVKGSKMKNNVAQTLMRNSVVATLAHIRTIDVAIDRTDHQPQLRLVQNTQYGFVDPVSTPEGDNCGLVKGLCIIAKTSLERDDNEVIRYLMGENPQGIVYLNIESVTEQQTSQVISNAKFLGWCDGEVTRRALIAARRTKSVVMYDVSIILEDDGLFIDSTADRPIRPLLVLTDSQTLVIDNLALRNESINTMIAEGAIEFVSPWEQEYIQLASSIQVVEQRLVNIERAKSWVNQMQQIVSQVEAGQPILRPVASVVEHYTVETARQELASAEAALLKIASTTPYTHVEIDPVATLGTSASIIPYLNHNQAPRNTYQAAMGKQALGVYHRNHRNRWFDGKTKLLTYSHPPLVQTETYDLIGLNEHGQGETAVVAFMAWPYTEEDAAVIKREFVDNGGFRMMKYIIYRTNVRGGNSEITEELKRPKAVVEELRSNPDRYRYIQANGLPKVGAPLRQGDCVIGKVQRRVGEEDTNASILLKMGDEGIVEGVYINTVKAETIVTVKLRVMRIPEEADKFAPENAQKVTLGLVVPQAEMPRTAGGIVPDMIFNPAQIPSRMTMSYLMSILAGKYAALAGEFVNSTAFRTYDRAKYSKYLVSREFDPLGYETMYSNLTGEKLSGGPVFLGLIYIQALHHHVKDKIQARSRGGVKAVTRQPPKGRGHKGGIRFGEMERDNAISHGASSFARERTMRTADVVHMVFCSCGAMAVPNRLAPHGKPAYKCLLCGNVDNFGRVELPYAFKYLTHLLTAPGFNLYPTFVTDDEYRSRLTNGAVDTADTETDEINGTDYTEVDGDEVETDLADVYDD